MVIVSQIASDSIISMSRMVHLLVLQLAQDRLMCQGCNASTVTRNAQEDVLVQRILIVFLVRNIVIWSNVCLVVHRYHCLTALLASASLVTPNVLVGVPFQSLNRAVHNVRTSMIMVFVSRRALSRLSYKVLIVLHVIHNVAAVVLDHQQSNVTGVSVQTVFFLMARV